ncbi:MAG: hypothetical protein WD266_11770 [Balneolales bacterium]
MKKHFIYYVLLFTGILIIVVGLYNLISHWRQGDFTGFVGQFIGIVCLLGGGVNLWVASKVKKDIPAGNK